MAVSESLSYSFYRLFSDNRSFCPNIDSGGYSSRYTNFMDSVFKRYIKVSIEGNHIEYPICIKTNIEDRLNFDKSHPNFYVNMPLKEAIVPINSYYDIGIIKTADSMLRKFFETSRTARLIKADNGKGSIYYGSKGLILDSNLNPLMCIYVTSNFDVESNNWILGEPIIRIVPEVFINQQEFMNKAIIQKILYLGMSSINYSSLNVYIKDVSIERCKVEVVPLDNFFITPTKPTPSTCTKETLNTCLKDNIEEVISLMR